MQVERIIVKNYRSISNLPINFIEGKTLIITGPNNVGKTNLLRAFDLFFSLDTNKFDPKQDIPFDIAEGTAGGGNKIRFESVFTDNLNTYSIIVEFKRVKGKGKVAEIKAKKNGKRMSPEEGRKIILSYKYIFLQSSNVDIPKLISSVVENELLPSLDRKRKTQSAALEELEKFIDASKKAVEHIEKNLWEHFQVFVDNVNSLDTTDWRIKILFPEFNKLREAITDLVELTLYDKNDRKISAKGSGVQWILLMSIIKYLITRSNTKTIIAIDEPEAFLQPTLQKRVAKILHGLLSENKNNSLIITTHSPHLIDINDLSNTYLFHSLYDKRPITRRNNEIFYKIKTSIKELSGFEKADAIKKQLGIERNDSWGVMPFNLMVEGEEDKAYLTSLFKLFGIEVPNILVAGGASKIKGYLQFMKEFCEDAQLSFKPRVNVILDYDLAGKSEYASLISSAKKYPNFTVHPIYINRADGDIQGSIEYEIEDFIYPEIIFEATNKILKSRKYKTPRFDPEKRFSKAFGKDCILKYITEEVKRRNSDKDLINFEEEGWKLLLCKHGCEIINVSNPIAYDLLYPKVKEYLEKIIK